MLGCCWGQGASAACSELEEWIIIPVLGSIRIIESADRDSCEGGMQMNSDNHELC